MVHDDNFAVCDAAILMISPSVQETCKAEIMRMNAYDKHTCYVGATPSTFTTVTIREHAVEVLNWVMCSCSDVVETSGHGCHLWSDMMPPMRFVNYSLST